MGCLKKSSNLTLYWGEQPKIYSLHSVWRRQWQCLWVISSSVVYMSVVLPENSISQVLWVEAHPCSAVVLGMLRALLWSGGKHIPHLPIDWFLKLFLLKSHSCWLKWKMLHFLGFPPALCFDQDMVLQLIALEEICAQKYLLSSIWVCTNVVFLCHTLDVKMHSICCSVRIDHGSLYSIHYFYTHKQTATDCQNHDYCQKHSCLLPQYGPYILRCQSTKSMYRTFYQIKLVKVLNLQDSSSLYIQIFRLLIPHEFMYFLDPQQWTIYERGGCMGGTPCTCSPILVCQGILLTWTESVYLIMVAYPNWNFCPSSCHCLHHYDFPTVPVSFAAEISPLAAASSLTSVSTLWQWCDWFFPQFLFPLLPFCL